MRTEVDGRRCRNRPQVSSRWHTASTLPGVKSSNNVFMTENVVAGGITENLVSSPMNRAFCRILHKKGEL